MILNLPTILIPSAVFNLTTCIFVLWPVLAAKTPSIRDQTDKTDPERTLYVLLLSPTSQSKLNVTFLQFPFLEKKMVITYD